jgi:hypothetical protein
MGSRSYNFDIQTLLKDAGAITASAAAQVSGAAQILDMGAARFEAMAVVDVTALDISSADESYRILIQGSNSASFASGIQNLANADLGATAARPGGAADSLVGRYELMVTNEQADVTYRYIRAYTVVGGTTPSINYTAFLSLLPDP